jgi:hypothetical protein
VKLQQLEQRRAFLADLLLVGLERVVDDILGADDSSGNGEGADGVAS